MLNSGFNLVACDCRVTFKGAKTSTYDGKSRTQNVVSVVWEGDSHDFYFNDDEGDFFHRAPDVGQRCDIVGVIVKRTTPKGKATYYNSLRFFPAGALYSLVTAENIKAAYESRPRKAAA